MKRFFVFGCLALVACAPAVISATPEQIILEGKIRSSVPVAEKHCAQYGRTAFLISSQTILLRKGVFSFECR
jgi:hypothetical protein